jgi:hypothetical protein
MLFFLATCVSPVQAALKDMTCEYNARQAFSGTISQVYQGQVLSAPDCQFPVGTTVSYTWRILGEPFSNSSTFTVPDGSRGDIILNIVATNAGFNTTTISFRGAIMCQLPAMSVTMDRSYLTPKSPVIVTANSSDPAVTFSYSRDYNPQMNVTLVSRGVWKLEISSAFSAFGVSNSFIVSQSKPNCITTSQSFKLPLGHQIGPVVFGPLTGDVLRVGMPIGLKRLALSATATVRYQWEVGGKFYTTTNYTPTQTDLGKAVSLLITVEDAATGWPQLVRYVDYEYGSGGTIYNSLPAASATPTPTPTQPTVGNGNSGGIGPTPKPIESPSPSQSPTQSSSPSATPVKTVVPSNPVAPVTSKTYASCTALRKAFVNGVARDATALKKYKAKTKPRLNNSVYKLNIKLDTDKDGLACER